MSAILVELNDRLVSSALLTENAGVISSGMTLNFTYDVESNFPLLNVDLSLNKTEESVHIQQVKRWSAEKTLRFRDLAKREALGELPIEEQAELEALSRLRRSLKNPRTADEILWERRQKRLTSELVAALNKYVEFHEVPGYS